MVSRQLNTVMVAVYAKLWSMTNFLVVLLFFQG